MILDLRLNIYNAQANKTQNVLFWYNICKDIENEFASNMMFLCIISAVFRIFFAYILYAYNMRMHTICIVCIQNNNWILA